MDSWFQVGKTVAGQQQQQQQQQKSSLNNSLPRNDVEDPKDALNVELPVNDDDKIDTFISSALGRLSFQERDKVYLELHGVDGAVDERPDMVRERLNQFDACLIVLMGSFPKQGSKAYTQAALLDSEYVQSFRLPVLRAVRFDVEQAADRFLKFWDMKMRLFGEEKLCKTITLEDLNKDDMKTMKAGFIQIVPGRDSAGRAVAVLLPDFQTYEEPENFVSQEMHLCWLNAKEAIPHRLASVSGCLLHDHEYLGRRGDSEKGICGGCVQCGWKQYSWQNRLSDSSSWCVGEYIRMASIKY